MWPSRAVRQAFSYMKHRALGSSWALAWDSSCRLCGWLLKSQWSGGEAEQQVWRVLTVTAAHKPVGPVIRPHCSWTPPKVP